MTSWTSEDRKNAEKAERANEEYDGGIPIPFGGWMKVADTEELEQMLRHQLDIQQRRITELTQEVATAYKKGWNEAIDAALEKVKKGL